MGILNLRALSKYCHCLFFQGPQVVALDVQQRCFSVSPLAAMASKVAMSRLDTAALPYEQLASNIEIVKKRYVFSLLTQLYVIIM